MRPELTLILLFTVATAVAIATQRLGIPYTVALVLAGLGLGAAHVTSGAHLTKDLLFAVFLPGLLFEASYHLKFPDFRKNARAIVALAVPGVVAAIGATAFVLVASAKAFATQLDMSHALVFSALIAATDPIAVVALFKTVGAPKRLGVLMEGESLVNDGTAVVLFTIVFAGVSGGGVSIASGAIDFVRIVGLGIAVGAVFGVGGSLVLKRTQDPMVEITLSTIVAYGSFVVAEEFQVSGVIATVTAGMFFGSWGALKEMTPSSRTAVESFWEYLAFAFNSIVFLLIGLAVPIGHLLQSWRPILLAFFGVTVGRAIVVAGATLLLRPSPERIPWRYSVVLTWGGLRGALSMVLALSIPETFPSRDLIVTMTFGVVLLSIVVQGVTTGPLLKKLGLTGGHDVVETIELS